MPSSFKQISVIGLGYIGLPTAATFASRGVPVVGVDVKPAVVEQINRGEAHFPEPELDMLVQAAVSTGRLRAVTRPEPADAFIVAVPTPFTADRQPDLHYIEAAAQAIAPVLKAGDLVVLESTSPVGATARLAGWLAAARPDLRFPQQAGVDADIRVAHCPERILPGRMITELVENDRIIGGMTPACTARATALYRLFVTGACLETSAEMAELVKLTENAFRDVNIAFANELSMLCDRLGLNVWEAIRLANHHPRVNILTPGPGVGGHCIAVDPWFIVASAPETARLIRTARDVNDSKPIHVLGQIRNHARILAATTATPPVIACLGLAYKADVDDLRESPAVQIVRELAAEGIGAVLAVEPYTSTLPASLAAAGVLQVGLEEALERADIVVLLVDHAVFRALPAPHRPGRVLIDTRGIWPAAAPPSRSKAP